MTRRYLEVTYRHGKPFAAYLYLPRRTGDRGERVERCDGGYLVDWTADGRPIGIEIPSPSLATLEGLNGLLVELGLDELEPGEVSPLVAA